MTVTTALVLLTLYEYYTNGSISSGLSADQPYFTLNDKNITIYSGAMHYFRVPKPYWRDRLIKMRAAGLNAVETYVPWNLHEPSSGNFDFGQGGSDMQDFLDVQEFFQTVKEEDLFAIIRPGPYICAEWEFGGFPSWLLRENDIKLRSSDPVFMKYVRRYFNALLSVLAPLQFTNGGSIIAVQIENEYGSTASSTFKPDKEYLKELRQLMLDNNIVELLVSADGVGSGSVGSLPEYFLQTANFGSDPVNEFNTLKTFQTNKPSMAMEFYSGWFDHWTETHHTRSTQDLINNLQELLEYPGSFNFYMFHGGTSFGFMSGGNFGNSEIDNSGYQPDTTSYDYDSPITEDGNYTEKYYAIKDLLEFYNEIPTIIPDPPEVIPTVAYPTISIEKEIKMENLIKIDAYFGNKDPVSMEMLPINNDSGQSYGYLVYRKENLSLQPMASLKISGHITDTVMVLVNGIRISPSLNNASDLDGFGFWRLKDSTITLTKQQLSNATLDIVVENWGRVGYGAVEQLENQFKGIWQGDVSIDDVVIQDWKMIPFEFKKAWTNSLHGWDDVDSLDGPSLYKASLEINEVRDTYINMEGWTKGIVIVNGFVLGRYAKIGPQQALYLPAPFLKQGVNDFVVFEHFKAAGELVFSTGPIYKTLGDFHIKQDVVKYRRMFT